MNCKPGDLAICISSDAMPEFIGKIVKVTRICETCPWPNHWETEPSEFKGTLEIVYDDADLRPVSGLPMEEETEQKLREPA